jgi:putative ABC transport system permease protein
MIADIVVAVLEQSLLLMPLTFGVFLSYRILKVTDLSVDGTYVLGAVVFARLVPIVGVGLAMIVSLLMGALVGCWVAFMQRDNKIDSLVVGVLTSFMLYSINLQILGRPNISLLNYPTLSSIFELDGWLKPCLVLASSIFLGMTVLLRSSIGLKMRAFGHKAYLLKTLGYQSEHLRMLGLALSNALAALTGSMSAQVSGYSDIHMGVGVALVAIGSVVIGKQLLISSHEPFSLTKELLSPCVGIICYFSAVMLLLSLGINPSHLKIVLGLFLLTALRTAHQEGRLLYCIL